MASKMVMDRQKSAEAVAALSQAQSVGLGAQLAQQLNLGAGEVTALLDRLAGVILQRRDDMVNADVAHEAELGDDPSARDARDEIAGALSSALVELREIVTGLYGREAAERVFPSATPRDPVQLARFAAEVAKRLESGAPGASRLPGASLDAPTLARNLADQAQTLGQRLSDVARETRETQATQVARDAALTRYDEAFTGIATVFEGLFLLAGQRELADRVRPSRRRPGQTAASASDKTTT